MAAVLNERFQKGIHGFDLGAIDHPATVALDAYEPGIHQDGQVAGQFVRCKSEMFSDGACLHAVRAGFHECAEGLQPRILGKCRELIQSLREIRHVSQSTGFQASASNMD